MPATAVVRVTLNIHLSQPWSDKATVEEVIKQAKREATLTIGNLIHKQKNIDISRPAKVTVIYEEDK